MCAQRKYSENLQIKFISEIAERVFINSEVIFLLKVKEKFGKEGSNVLCTHCSCNEEAPWSIYLRIESQT